MTDKQERQFLVANIKSAPKCLNTNDKAMWVTGWNDCLEALAAPPAQPAEPDDVAGCLACVTCGQPAPAQPDTAAQEREHMGDPDKRTGIYAAPAQRLSDEQLRALYAELNTPLNRAESPIELFRMICRAIEAAIVPPGYVVVPVEPTDEMVEAAWDSDAADYVGEHKRIWQVAAAYRTMIAAAKDKP